MANQAEELRWLMAYIKQCQENRHFGNVVIQFKDGEIYLVREEKTVKPPKSDYFSV